MRYEMKKYISTILINALLIQFAGCYSQREITYDEFYIMQRTEEATIEIKNGDTFDLDSDSLRQNYIKWEKSEDAITIYPTRIEKDSSFALIEVVDTVSYSKEDLSIIYLEEFDTSQTIMGITVGVVFLVIVAIIASTYTFRIY
jgi:hypothetical protein